MDALAEATRKREIAEQEGAEKSDRIGTLNGEINRLLDQVHEHEAEGRSAVDAGGSPDGAIKKAKSVRGRIDDAREALKLVEASLDHSRKQLARARVAEEMARQVVARTQAQELGQLIWTKSSDLLAVVEELGAVERADRTSRSIIIDASQQLVEPVPPWTTVLAASGVGDAVWGVLRELAAVVASATARQLRETVAAVDVVSVE